MFLHELLLKCLIKLPSKKRKLGSGCLSCLKNLRYAYGYFSKYLLKIHLFLTKFENKTLNFRQFKKYNYDTSITQFGLKTEKLYEHFLLEISKTSENEASFILNIHNVNKLQSSITV